MISKRKFVKYILVRGVITRLSSVPLPQGHGGTFQDLGKKWNDE
jgi:hypothetical protein